MSNNACKTTTRIEWPVCDYGTYFLVIVCSLLLVPELNGYYVCILGGL